MEQIAARAQRLPAPPHIVFEALTQPDRPGARPWLALRDDEQPPRILATTVPGEGGASEMFSVKWSSLWPGRAGDEIRLTITPDAAGSRLHFELRTPDPATEAEIGHLRYRLNHLFFADLRFSFGQ